MANVTAAEVKRLRDATGAGMMDTKKALEETDGEFDQATELLRIKGPQRRRRRGAENRLERAGGRRGHCDDRAGNAKRTSLRKTPISSSLPVSSGPTAAVGPSDVETLRAATLPTAGRWPRRSSPPRRSSARRSSCVESPCSTGRSCRICTAGPVTCHRRSACWWNIGGADAAAARGAAMQIAAMRPQFVTRDEVPAESSRTSGGSPRRRHAKKANQSRR